METPRSAFPSVVVAVMPPHVPIGRWLECDHLALLSAALKIVRRCPPREQLDTPA